MNLTELLAIKMNESPIEHGCFRILVMNQESFQGWFRLSAHVRVRKEWFEAFANANDDEINSICQQILHKLFSIMEDGIVSTISSEKGFLDYLLSKEFEELYEQRLPQKLKGNRQCAIYLVESLRCLFYEWYRDALSLLIQNDTSDPDDPDEMDPETLLIIVHNIIGGAIPKLKERYKRNSRALHLINSMAFRRFEGATDSYYEEFVPEYIKHRDKGALSLIGEKFIRWAKDLIKFCVRKNSDRSINKEGNKWIKVGFDELKKKQCDLFITFRTTALSLTVDDHLDDTLIYQIYKRVSLYTMRAYSKSRNNTRFNSDKKSSKDMSNVKFRTLVQCGKMKLQKKKRPPKKSFSDMMEDVNKKNGVPTEHANATVSPMKKKSRSKSKMSTDEEMQKIYHSGHKAALAKYKHSDTKTLSKKEVCTLLYVDFDIYHHASKRERGLNHEVLRAKLIGCIASNPWPYGEEGADDTTADSSIASAASQVAVPALPPLPSSSLPSSSLPSSPLPSIDDLGSNIYDDLV